MKPSLLTSFYGLLIRLPVLIGWNYLRFANWESGIKNAILVSFGLGVGYSEWLLFDRLWEVVERIPFGFQIILPNLFTYAGSFLFIFLAYSSVLTSLSSLYRSRDLPLLLALPIRLEPILFYKWGDTAVRSAVTLVALMVPLMISIGMVMELSSIFYLIFMLAVLLISAIGVSLGFVVAMLLMLFFPVKRLNQSVAILGLIMAAFLVFGLRFLHLETLWSNQAVQNPMIVFLQQEPAGWVKYGPGELFSKVVSPALFAESLLTGWFLICILLGVGAVGASLLIGRFIFMYGWWKSQEQQDQSLRKKGNASARWIEYIPLPGKIRSMLWKDYVLFTRDPSVWTQLLMMVPLALMYLLNLWFLPDLGENAAPFMTVANVGLIALIISAIGARFIFPTASREGLAVWMPFVSPLSPIGFIFQKALFVLPPVLMLTLGLLLLSAKILLLPEALFWWNIFYGLGLVLMLGVQSLCLGVWFPSYNHHHIMEVSLGKGAILFMVMALFQTAGLVYVIVRDILAGVLIEIPMINVSLSVWLFMCLSLTLVTFLGSWKKLSKINGIR